MNTYISNLSFGIQENLNLEYDCLKGGLLAVLPFFKKIKKNL